MAHWLLKTEPEEFSWDDQVKRGSKGEAWSGVRNFIARRNLKAMKKGEKFFFYHTGDEKQIVGIGEIVREAYADPTAKKGEPWVAVTTAAVEPLPSSAAAAQIASRIWRRRSRLLVAGSARAKASSTETEASRVRKSLSEISTPASSRKN